jgi:hypothetical protein
LVCFVRIRFGVAVIATVTEVVPCLCAFFVAPSLSMHTCLRHADLDLLAAVLAVLLARSGFWKQRWLLLSASTDLFRSASFVPCVSAAQPSAAESQYHVVLQDSAMVIRRSSRLCIVARFSCLNLNARRLCCQPNAAPGMLAAPSRWHPGCCKTS